LVNFDLESEAPYLFDIIDTVYPGNLRVSRIIKGAHDTNWTKEHELFYSEQTKSKPFVSRLFFKDGKKSWGFVHLRPTSDLSELTETYLAPPKIMTQHPNRYFIKCKRKFEEYGETIDCVPFIMPETIFGMCAQGSIWICLKILENMSKGKIAACDIPHIQTLATGRPYADYQGLKFVQIARLLRMCKCNAFYTSNEDYQLSDMEILFSLYSYVESGLPVIIGVDTKDLPWWNTNTSGYHSIVVIGHTMKDGIVDGFIVHDESKYPYQVLTINELLSSFHGVDEFSSIREFAVAVPSKVGLRYEYAYQQWLAFKAKISNLNLLNWRINRINSFRPILMSLEEFTNHIFMEKHINNYGEAWTLLIDIFRRIEFTKYSWVFLFYQSVENRMNEKDVGFFLRDATRESDIRLLFLPLEKKIIFQQNRKIYTLEFDRRGIPRKRKVRII